MDVTHRETALKGKYLIGIDLGGTSIKAGILTEDFEILRKTRLEIDALAGAEKIVSQISAACWGLMTEAGVSPENVAGIGIGSPGLIDTDTGTVLFSNNFDWENVLLADMVRRETGIPVQVANDANCAVLGESVRGSAQNMRDVVLLTLGTGVGSGILSRGRLLNGTGAGGIAGHMTIVENGKSCTCGKRGCLEAYASATALIECYREKCGEYGVSVPDEVTGKDVLSAVRAGSPPALAAFRDWAEALSTGIATLIDLLRPETVLLGGGLSNAGKLLTKEVNARLPEKCYAGKFLKPCEVRIAALKNDAGIYGAAALIHLSLSEEVRRT